MLILRAGVAIGSPAGLSNEELPSVVKPHAAKLAKYRCEHRERVRQERRASMKDLSRQAVGGQEGEDEAASVLNAITGKTTTVREQNQEEALEKKRLKRVQEAREEAEAAKKEEREDERARWDPKCWKKVERGGVSYFVNLRTREIKHDNPFPTGTTIKPKPLSPVGTGGPMLYDSNTFRTDPVMKYVVRCVSASPHTRALDRF